MTEPSPPPSLIILGGGCCGLYAALTALRRGVTVTVIEKAEQVGGLAAGTPIEGNYYDLGVHMLHAFDEEIYEDVANLMGETRLEVSLDARIRWGEGTYRYPLKFVDLVKEMPKWSLLCGVAGLLAAELKRAVRPVPTNNAEDALIAFYGKPLYRFFFEEFTSRYWGIHPREISDEFVKRKMPRLSAVDFIKKALFPAQKSSLATESSLEEELLHYSKRGAYSLPRALQSEIVRLGGTILTEAELLRITPGAVCPPENAQSQKGMSASKGVRVITSQDHVLRADYCLSTLPLSSLLRAIEGAPPAVSESAAKLKYKPIVVFGLLVNRQKAMDGLYTYYRERVFHRVGEPKNAGLEVTPRDHTVLIVEMTCEEGDEKWRCTPQIKAQITADLESEGLCEASEIVQWHTLHYAQGYPVYALGYETHLERVQTWVSSQPWLASAGRQGQFAYPGMHRAMRMGAEAVEKLLGV